MYDPRKVEEMFLRNLKISVDEVLQPLPGTEDVDPVSENVAAAMSRPVYVLPRQDHVAHLKTHIAFIKSPLFGQNPVIMKTYLYPMVTHLRDHLLNYYLAEAHEAVDQAQRKHLIEEDAEQQVKIILQVQQFIEQQLNGFAQELAQLEQVAAQFAPQPQMPPDSSMQVAQLGAQTQMQLAQQRDAADKAKLEQDGQIKQATMQQSAQIAQQKSADDREARQLAMATEQLRQQAEDARTQADLQARIHMNDSDNETAMRLAAAEIASGEKVSFSTGSGINPGT
jgi:hypothetical protein